MGKGERDRASKMCYKYKAQNFPVTRKLIEKYINNISIKKEVMNLRNIVLIIS